MEAPLLKMDVAKARSFFGKYSAVTLMAARKFPASPNARTSRKARKNQTDTVDTASIAVGTASLEATLTTQADTPLSCPLAVKAVRNCFASSKPTIQ